MITHIAGKLPITVLVARQPTTSICTSMYMYMYIVPYHVWAIMYKRWEFTLQWYACTKTHLSQDYFCNNETVSLPFVQLQPLLGGHAHPQFPAKPHPRAKFLPVDGKVGGTTALGEVTEDHEGLEVGEEYLAVGET